MFCAVFLMNWNLLLGISTLPFACIGMSLFKKLVTHRISKQNVTVADSSCSHTSIKSEDTVTSCNTSMNWVSDSADETFSDEIAVEHKKKRRKLNHALRKYRKREKHLTRKQREIVQLENEIKEIGKLLHENKTKSSALDEELDHKRKELMSLCQTVPEDVEKEAKKREPLLYKKFCSVKSLAEMESVLGLIEVRKRAIKNIEILAYQKYVSLKHTMELKEKASQNPPPLPPKPNYDHIFNSIREKLTFNSTETTLPWLHRSSVQHQQSTITEGTTITGSSVAQGEIIPIELTNLSGSDVNNSVLDSAIIPGFSTSL